MKAQKTWEGERDLNWELEIEFVPYESEKDRDRAYEQWVELFLKADARRLASLDRQNR